MKNNCFSQNITVFHERSAPEQGYLAGYAALFNAFDLQSPLPDVLSIISHKYKHYTTPQWRIFTHFRIVHVSNVKNKRDS